ncbi:MAG: hypothetical protein MUF64_16215 [Polyangiaceae bacterium]|nr:hypothetical protein [Polyangiaceae bacterium]
MSDELRELVSGWQSTLLPPSDDELSDQIRLVEAALLENQQLGYQIHAHLTRYPEQLAEARSVLDAWNKEQGLLMQKLGELMLEWRRRGGNFDLRKRGEPKVAPAPRPRVEEPKDEEDEEDEEEEKGEDKEEAPSSPRTEETRVTSEDLRAWREQLLKKQTAPVVRPTEVPEHRQRAVLLSLMNSIGEIRELNSMVNIVDEVDGLEQITSAESRTQWALMSKPMQRVWLSMLVARTRAVKDATTTNPALRERIKAFILQFPAYAKTYQPGYVNGLQVSHNPERGSWRDDALHFWAQLRPLTVAPPEPEPEPEEPHETTSVPASTIVASAPSQETEDDGPAIDSQWPLWSLVRDKRGILLGGEPREPARVRLENAFAMAELEWIPGDNPRRLDSVVERVGQNKVDIVFVLQQWTAHKVTNKLIDACKNSGVPWALVSSYSIKSIRAGLDRFLGANRDVAV